jgi:uncharacterized protein YjbJ (UPF0337 family)
MDPDRIKGAAQDIGGKVQEAAGKAFGDQGTQAEGIVRQVAGNAQNLYGQAKDNLSNVASSAQDLYGQARQNVSSAADTVQDYANQAYRQASPHAERGTALVRDRVGENPLTAVLLAGAIGYLLALAIHGRS